MISTVKPVIMWSCKIRKDEFKNLSIIAWRYIDIVYKFESRECIPETK